MSLRFPRFSASSQTNLHLVQVFNSSLLRFGWGAKRCCRAHFRAAMSAARERRPTCPALDYATRVPRLDCPVLAVRCPRSPRSF